MQGWNKMDELQKQLKEVQGIAERARKHANDLETKIQYLQNQIIEIKNLKTSEDKKNKKSKGE